jgi:hypothetical protein
MDILIKLVSIIMERDYRLQAARMPKTRGIGKRSARPAIEPEGAGKSYFPAHNKDHLLEGLNRRMATLNPTSRSRAQNPSP